MFQTVYRITSDHCEVDLTDWINTISPNVLEEDYPENYFLETGICYRCKISTGERIEAIGKTNLCFNHLKGVWSK